MDTRFIQTLLSVVQNGSFAGAARSENLTPAAVAQRIRSLEADLDTPLIVRAGQTVAPTPECLSILPRLRGIAHEMKLLSTDLDANSVDRAVRLGSISTVLGDRVPHILADFARDAPTSHLSIVPGTSEELYAKLTNGEIDAALMIRPPFEIAKSLNSILIERQPFVLVAPVNDERSASQILKSEQALIYDLNSWGGRPAARWIKDHVQFDKVRCELDALEAIAIAVGRGFGFSIVPDWPGLEDLHAVRRLSLDGLDASRDLVLLHRRLAPATLDLLARPICDRAG